MSEDSTITTPSEAAPEPAAAPEKKSKPINRKSIGFNVTLQIILGLILFGFVNYFGNRHFIQWDKTYDHEFTLSEDTLTFLKQLDKKITISVICHKGTPEHRDVMQLVEGYHREGKSKLKIEMIDPVKDNEAFEKVSSEASRLRIKVDDLGLFIRVSKSSTDKPASTDPAAPDAPPAANFIPLGSMFRYTTDVNNRPVLSSFAGESALTAGLMAIARGDQPKLYVVAYKSKLRTTQKGNAVTVLNAMAARQNMKIATIGLHEEDNIPEDANALVLIGLDSDLDKHELDMVREYWQGKGHSIFIMLNCQGDYPTPMLESFLAENGVVPQADRILKTYGTATGTEKQFETTTTFLDGSTITQSQKGNVTTIPGRSRSLKLTPDAEKPRTENIELKPLLSPTAGYWGEVNYEDDAPQADERDNKPPLYTAVSVERGASKDAQISMDSSRMVVIANSAMLDPDGLIPANYDFVNSSLNWLIQREKYLGINPTPKSMFSIKITEAQKGRIFLLTTIVLPLAVFMLGVFVWGARRS